jgi:hypothetical protein
MSEQPKLVLLPPDWVAVPREAKVEMYRALIKSWGLSEETKFRIGVWFLGSFDDDYKAMLSAAPQLPDETEKFREKIRDEAFREAAEDAAR